jgi:hypothetical protein
MSTSRTKRGSAKSSPKSTLIKILVLLAIIPSIAAAVFLIHYYYIFD